MQKTRLVMFLRIIPQSSFRFGDKLTVLMLSEDWLTFPLLQLIFNDIFLSRNAPAPSISGVILLSRLACQLAGYQFTSWLAHMRRDSRLCSIKALLLFANSSAPWIVFAKTEWTGAKLNLCNHFVSIPPPPLEASIWSSGDPGQKFHGFGWGEQRPFVSFFSLTTVISGRVTAIWCFAFTIYLLLLATEWSLVGRVIG